MRRENLATALDRVTSALVQSNAYKLLVDLNRISSNERNTPPEGLVRALIQGYATFVVKLQEFGPDELKLLKEFGLESLADPDTWSMRTKASGTEVSLTARIRYALETFSRFKKMLQRDSDDAQVAISTDKKSAQSIATKKITFLIRELDSPSLTLRDLSSVISDIESIFQCILKISGGLTSDLVVASLDSGSDKSIDLIGVATTVEKLSSFLLEVWDRIRFGRATKVRVSIKAVSDGLSLLNELKAAQDKGAISPEEAEKLKRVLLKSVDDLFLKGVYTRDMEQSVPVQPSALEFQRTRLLTHYKADNSKPPENGQGGDFEDDRTSGDED